MSVHNEVESYAASWVFPYLREQAGEGYSVIPVPNDICIQHRYGDKWLSNHRKGTTIEVELKAERHHTGNLFIETWSDETNAVQGWLYHYSDKTRLAYAFNDCHKIYTCHMGDLRRWCHSPGEMGRLRIEDFKAVEQKQYEQKNKTVGRLVPVTTFLTEVKGARIHELAIV